MADGVELVADAWVPEEGGPWPVLLQRLPYGRSVASTPVLPHPSWFARHGYAVVVQDCRGRGDSGGRFEPFVDEAPDGAATIEWAARLPFCDGRVATYGFSYQGLNQLYAAALAPPSLHAIAPMMCATEPGEGWTYEGGALRWPFVCFWAAQLAGQDRQSPPIPFSTSAVPIADALGTTPPTWFEEWVANADDAEYWAARRPDIDAIRVPAFSVLGWFDDFSSGTGELIERLGAEAWCGPWGHMPWGAEHGGHDFGSDADPSPVWEGLVAFFDRVFDRRATSESARVRYYVIGDEWRAAPTWPPPHTDEDWTAESATGNALSRWGDGRLSRGSSTPMAHPTTVVAEPHVPVPGEPLDYQDEASLHDRRDIACFTSDAFERCVDIAGTPTVSALTGSDRPRHDLVATLCTVAPDGETRVITGYAARLIRPVEIGERTEWSIRLRPIAARIPAGHRIRLTIAASRFPCYDRNAHDGIQSPTTTFDEQTVATIDIHRLALRLPILDGDQRPKSNV
jgi:hypothetical protein